MTKATPQVIVKKPKDEPEDIGLKGGPVKQDTRSWRERAGKRRSFGSPTGGWPEFDERGHMVKRRTDTKPAGMKTPKGYAYICFECALKADMGDEFTVMRSVLRNGTCDNCGAEHTIRMSVEAARYKTLLAEVGRAD